MSLYNMSASEIICSSNFVKEPVEEIRRKIDISSTDRIILTGPRSSGKSMVLQSCEKEGLGTGKDAIYHFIDPNTSVSYLSEKEQAYYIEYLLVSKIYYYIKKNYSKIYRESFEKEDQKLKDIHNSFGKSIDFIPEKGGMIGDLVSKMKQLIGMDTITICLDRFDWVECNSSTYQKMVEFYFQFFDKVILTSDDSMVYKNHDRREVLKEKGYTVIDVDYGKRIRVAKQIVSADLRYYAVKKHENNSKLWNKQFVDLKGLIETATYNELIRKCHGDFKLLFDTIKELYMYGELDDIHINEKMLKYYDWVMDSRNKLEQTSYVKKLHL